MTFGLWIERRGDPASGYWHTCRGVTGGHCLFDEESFLQEFLKNGYDNSFSYTARPYATVGGSIPRTQMGHLHGLPKGLAPLHAAGRPIISPKDCFNPSVLEQDNGQLLVSLRAPDAKNYLGYLDPKTGETRRVRELLDEEDSGYCFEDLRLFYRGDELWASCAAVDQRRPSMALVRIEEGCLVKSYLQPSPFDEKNWMPITNAPGPLRMVYALEPTLSLVTISEDKRNLASPLPASFPKSTRWLRGGTQVIGWGKEYLGLVHCVYFEEGYPIYVHRFVKLDAELSSFALSRPFYFFSKGIEFAAGLATWEGRFLITFGAADRTAHLTLVEAHHVMALFE